MKSIKFVSALIIVLIVGGWLTIKSLTIHIPIGRVGVRIQQYSIFGKKGVVMEDFGPGWHRDLGLIDNWETFDSTVQTLEMTRDPYTGSAMGPDNVKVQSADGYAISLDVTIKYRMMTGNVYRVYQDTGSGTKYKTIVRNEAQKACMSLFGTMKTEDFYNPEARRKCSKQVKKRLSESLENNFVEIIDVLIRNVQFDPEYERKIRRRKLADQEVELNKSMARAAGMSGKTQVIEAETKKLVNIVIREQEAKLIRMQATTDLEIAQITADYRKYVTEKEADADLIAAQNDAKGQRLVKEAEAEGERLRNEAIQGAGGTVIVALEAARNLNFADVTISTIDVDLLDISGMVSRLGLPEKRKK